MSPTSLTILPDGRLKPGVAVNIRGTPVLLVSEQDMGDMWGMEMPEVVAHLNTMQQVMMSEDIFEGCLAMRQDL